MAGTVFVTQENPRVNILPAMKWGELSALAAPYDQIMMNSGRVVSEILLKLQEFDDEDWLLLMGDPAIIGIAFAIAADVNSGRVNVLKWDKQEQAYYPVHVNLQEDDAETH